MSIKEVAKEIKELLLNENSLSDFENGGLLNMCMIAVYEMTDKDKIEYPHYYTITRCINEVLGRNTAVMRGREDRDENGKIKKAEIHNEGFNQSQVEKVIKANSPSVFVKGKSPAWMQDLELPHEKGRFLKGWRINHESTISFLGTGFLFQKISNEIKEFGMSPEKVSEILDDTVRSFYGELSESELEKERKKFKAKLNSLIKQKYLKYDQDKYLVIRELNQQISNFNITRKEIETCYLNYLYQKALKEINSSNSSPLSNNSNGGKLR